MRNENSSGNNMVEDANQNNFMYEIPQNNYIERSEFNALQSTLPTTNFGRDSEFLSSSHRIDNLNEQDELAQLFPDQDDENDASDKSANSDSSGDILADDSD